MFTNKAIKCNTWAEMLQLAELAKKEGLTAYYDFKEEVFNNGENYFVLTHDNKRYLNVALSLVQPYEKETTFEAFIATN